MARKGKGQTGSDNAPPRLPQRRNIESVQADLRKSTSGSPDRAATPRAPSERSDRLSLS